MFVGVMFMMVSVKFFVFWFIVNYLYYEDVGLRVRIKIVYLMYSWKVVEEVKWELIKLKVNYYILEELWCVRRFKFGCSMFEIWDVEDFVNVGKIFLCNFLVKDFKFYFIIVF